MAVDRTVRTVLTIIVLVLAVAGITLLVLFPPSRVGRAFRPVGTTQWHRDPLYQPYRDHEWIGLDGVRWARTPYRMLRGREYRVEYCWDVQIDGVQLTVEIVLVVVLAAIFLGLLHKKMPAIDEEEMSDEKGYFECYASFAKVLRAWFIAYGIGGPLVLLTKQNLRDALVDVGVARCVMVCFLAGAGLQVIISLIYKPVMWHLYVGAKCKPHRSTRWYRASQWLSECACLEIGIDFLTFVLFALGSYQAFRAIMP